MKYKNIKSAIHNLGHSFMSPMNYFDGQCVECLAREIVRQAPPELAINFSTGEVRPAANYPAVLLTSVANYRARLPEHLRSHNVDPGGVRDVTLHLQLTRLGYRALMTASDDRGMEHRIVVRQ